MSEKPLSFAVFFYYMYFGFDSSEADFFNAFRFANEYY